MNNVTLLGRLVRDPELKYANSGIAYTKTMIAINRVMSKQKKQQAEQNNQQTADFINITAFGKTAEYLASYAKKGKRIAVRGRIQTGSYSKDGQRIYTTEVMADEIIIIDYPGKEETQNRNAYTPEDEPEFFPIDDEDVPF